MAISPASEAPGLEAGRQVARKAQESKEDAKRTSNDQDLKKADLKAAAKRKAAQADDARRERIAQRAAKEEADQVTRDRRSNSKRVDIHA